MTDTHADNPLLRTISSYRPPREGTMVPIAPSPPSVTLRPPTESPLVVLPEKEALSAIAEYVESCKNGTNIVSFIGLDGAGKSTLCDKVADRLYSGHAFLNLEGYLMPRTERRSAGISPWHPDAFDHEAAIRDITSLITEGYAEVPTYSHHSGQIEGSQKVVLPRGSILLLDEVTAIHLAGAVLAKPHYISVTANDAIRWQRVWRRNKQEGRGLDENELARDFERKYVDFTTHIAPRMPSPELFVDTTADTVYGLKRLALPHASKRKRA